jgi:hypothetical protein
MAVGPVAVIETGYNSPAMLTRMGSERRPAGADVSIGQGEEGLMHAFEIRIHAVDNEEPSGTRRRLRKGPPTPSSLLVVEKLAQAFWIPRE